MEKVFRQEMTFREYHAIPGAEMLEMAKMGFDMFEQGRFKEARTIFTGLSSLDSKEPYYRTALGTLDLAEEDLDGAMLNFTSAITLNPKEVAAYVNRGEVYLRQGKIQEATADFKKAIETENNPKGTLTMRARLLAAAVLQAVRQAQDQIAAKEGKGKAAAKGAPASKAPAKKEAGKAAAKKK
jgi:tetratricopeptide (TPR) repeat protein